MCGSGRLKGSGRSAETGMIRDCLVILEGLRYRLLDHCLLFLEEWASCLSSIDGLILDWVILLFCSLSFIPFFGFVDSFFGFSIIDPPRETVGNVNSSLDSQGIRLTVSQGRSRKGPETEMEGNVQNEFGIIDPPRETVGNINSSLDGRVIGPTIG